MARELRNAKISFVSYVDKAANQTEFFFTKSSGPPSFEKKVRLFTKSEQDEQRLVYGIVYEPDVPDAHGDFMTAEEIEKAAHGFLAEAREIDINHSFEGGTGVVVESYVAPDDFMIGTKQITKGSWVLVTRASDEVWEQIKAGIITGYSMAGTADVYEEEPVEKAGFFNVFKQMLADKTGKETEEMRKEDMKESFEHALYPLLKRLERIEKNTDTEEKPEQTGDDERLKKLVEDMLAPLIERIEALEKARGASKQTADDASGNTEQVKKSIWSGLL
ncbi:MULTISPECIES: XkdF-like putative serine protease domain-containing protein [Bacillus]|uniref:XkdF-like putative serine protease domain-containing protein n=1 Tax=Bacillus rugosus TaxID=2715209 RepID=A0ACD4A2I1_9BACI|nr:MULTISPECIES: XkdF-like putative serine protease domain-containing protein [Bacillus]MBY4603530.1 phage portal protein [Bacillus sp. SPARC3]MEC1547397.1 XkdF-like putative serine protease domain-containing protein [Bacillus rugosus]NUF04748.1 phage portal protein [Bacillus rugosus]UPV80406.1 XkdF-like putative serine protease domain-containing protein [Bacillus rugosus]